jgi:hypothetical protein
MYDSVEKLERQRSYPFTITAALAVGVTYALLFYFAPIWLSGGILGFFFALHVRYPLLLEIRIKKLEGYRYD